MGTRQELPANIRKAMDVRGLKYKHVAERAGFSEGDFSNMLNGRKIIRAEYVPILANAIGASVNELFGITDQPA